VPSSGEKIGSTVLSSTKTMSEQSLPRWRRRGCLLEVPHSVPTRSALCHCVVRRHGEERSGRFLPLNVRQRIGRIAKARIAALAHHHDLQIIGVPMLDTMVIAFSFPICPAGIVWVTRVPCALTPAIVCVPSPPFSASRRRWPAGGDIPPCPLSRLSSCQMAYPSFPPFSRRGAG